MKIHCESCGAEFDPRGRKDCPACGADFSDNREFAAALAGAPDHGAAPVRDGGIPGAYNVIPQTPYIPPAPQPEKKKLPAGCWVGLGCLVPVILLILALVLIIVLGIIAGTRNARWEAPVDTGEVLTEDLTRLSWGTPARTGSCSVTCFGFERMENVKDEAGDPVYRFRFSFTNVDRFRTSVYPDDLYLETASETIDRVLLGEDWELNLTEYSLKAGETLSGWICFAIPEEEPTVELRYQGCTLAVRRGGTDQIPPDPGQN